MLFKKPWCCLCYFNRVMGKSGSIASKSGIVHKRKRLYYYLLLLLLLLFNLDTALEHERISCLFMTHLLPESLLHSWGPRGEKILVLIGKHLFSAMQVLTLFCIFCFSVPPPSASSKIFKFVIKATVFGLVGYGCYRIGQRTVQLILSMPAAQSYLQKLTEIRSQH